MAQHNPERSPDLEWLLQSGNASQETIVRFLLVEHYAATARLAYALLGEIPAAQRAVVEMFAFALLPNRSYLGDTSVRSWLDGVLIRIYKLSPAYSEALNPNFIRKKITVGEPPPNRFWQGWINLSPEYRMPYALQIIHELRISEIALILEDRPEAIGTKIEVAWRHLAHLFGGDSEMDRDEVKQAFLRVLDEQCQACGLEQGDITNLAAQVMGLTARKATRRQKISSLRQTVFGLAVVLLLIFLVREVNQRLPVSSPPPPVLHTVVVKQYIEVTSTPVPTPTPGPPLTVDSPLSEILNRVNSSQYFWKNLWADALVFNYGPAGYIGPPQVYRNQIWFQQPNRFLILGGSPAYRPDYILNSNPNQTLEVSEGIPQPNEGVRSPKTQAILPFSQAYSPPPQSSMPPYGNYLSVMVRPYLVGDPERDVQVTGTETVAGRAAIVVDWKAWKQVPSNRLWIDAETGLLLRMQSFKPDGDGVVVSETVITNLALNFTYPDNFFNPESSWFMQMAWGDLWQPVQADPVPLQIQMPSPPGRERLAQVPAPDGFDASQSRLAFQWSIDPNDPTQPGPTAELFADGYFLGVVEMGNPWGITCGRSPDGGVVAFIRNTGSGFDSGAGIRWFRLSDPGMVYDPLPNGEVGSAMAFSPDGQKLAFWGCGGTSENCGIYLYDLESRKNVKLMAIDNAWVLQWSPDGEMINVFSTNSTRHDQREFFEYIIDAKSGAVVYQRTFDAITSTRPTESPTRNWVQMYSQPSTGLNSCVNPQ